MSKIKKAETTNGFKHLSKVVTICLIAGIIIVSGFIIYYIFTPEPPYHEFFILNGEKKAENYPTNATVGEEIYFYVGIRNYLEKDLTFNISIYKGDNETDLTEWGNLNAEMNITTTNITIKNGEEWVSPKLNITFYEPGKRIIIAELYEVKASENKFLNIVYIRLNITA
ncbi:MAG: DUF1616 domain-containing protein [Promethearchaeota archaeon]|nr:MAG: DUF1616 domain-containing protein [Candidatus Lokiarchaeota archaeon]